MHRELADQDENEQIGLTNYRFKDLPNWAKKSMVRTKTKQA